MKVEDVQYENGSSRNKVPACVELIYVVQNMLY